MVTLRFAGLVARCEFGVCGLFIAGFVTLVVVLDSLLVV